MWFIRWVHVVFFNKSELVWIIFGTALIIKWEIFDSNAQNPMTVNLMELSCLVLLQFRDDSMELWQFRDPPNWRGFSEDINRSNCSALIKCTVSTASQSLVRRRAVEKKSSIIVMTFYWINVAEFDNSKQFI